MRSLLGSLLNRTPVPYVSPTGSGSRVIGGFYGDRTGRSAQLDAMGQVGIVFAIVSKCASGTASQNWHLYQSSASGKKEDRVEVTRHPALEVLRKPNEFFTRQELIEAGQQHIDLTGEGYTIVEFGQGTTLPIGLWYASPARMEPVKSPTEYLTGWIYKAPNGDEIPLDRREVIQLRMPDPNDPYRGLGPVQTVLSQIDSARYAAEWNKNFFMNSAEPGGIIEVDRHLNDDEFDEMKMRWESSHKGVARAHRVGILEQGKYIQNSVSQREMQFVELSNLSDEKVRQAFGFPKPLTGAVDDVNRANAEAAEYVFAKWLLVPRLERWKSALNNDFLPLFGANGQGLELDYDSPVTEDETALQGARTAAVSSAVALIDAGFDPTEVLEALGLPKMTFLGARKELAA